MYRERQNVESTEMTEASFQQCFDWIEKYHGKANHLDAQVRIEWWKEFQKDYDEVFFEAANYATDKMPPGMFPSKERMRGFVTEAREKLWQKVKDAEPKQPLTQAIQRERTPHGREQLKTMIQFQEKKHLSRQEYIDWMSSQGWAVAAAELKEFWDSEPERHAIGERYFELCNIPLESDQ